jgi:hypothetical protein
MHRPALYAIKVKPCGFSEKISTLRVVFSQKNLDSMPATLIRELSFFLFFSLSEKFWLGDRQFSDSHQISMTDCFCFKKFRQIKNPTQK